MSVTFFYDQFNVDLMVIKPPRNLNPAAIYPSIFRLSIEDGQRQISIVTRPNSWYLEDLLLDTASPVEERMVLEHLDVGTLSLPQQKLRTPWVLVSYLHVNVTLCPTRPVTLVLKDTVKEQQ